MQNPLQREQNRATIVRRKAAAAGQKESKVVVEEGGFGGAGERDGVAGALWRKRISDAI